MKRYNAIIVMNEKRGYFVADLEENEDGEIILFKDYEKELIASRDSRILSAVPSADIMHGALEKELKKQGDNPIGGFSVMNPINFFTNGWYSCYTWMVDEIKRGIAG